MKILYDDDDLQLTCSETNFDKYVIYCNSAAGLDRVTLNGIVKDTSKKSLHIHNIYTPFEINEINFIAKTAHWYQRPGVLSCIKILKNIINGHEEQTVIYGFSMGGFGAIHFGGELGITSVAFSPQATLEKDFDITEYWMMVSEYTKYHYKTFNSNIIDGKCTKAPIYMFYDGTHVLDKKHALYIIRKYKNCISFNIPYSGHACSSAVNSIYKIKRIIIEVLNHEFNDKKFRIEFFNNYHMDEYRTESAYNLFKYLCDIVYDHNFYVKLGMIRRKKYFDLCTSVCRMIEVGFPTYFEECLTCLSDDNEIVKHIVSMKKMGEYDKLLENSYTRKKICAIFYQNRKKYDQAEYLYRILYELDKHDVEIAGNLAFVVHKQGRTKEAINIIFRHIKMNGCNAQNMTFLGKIYFELKDYKNARKYLSLSFKYAIIFGEKISIVNRILYARSFKAEGDIAKAVEYLQRHLDEGKNSGEYLAHYGAFSIMEGHVKEGLIILNQAKTKKKYPLWTDMWIHKAHKII